MHAERTQVPTTIRAQFTASYCPVRCGRLVGAATASSELHEEVMKKLATQPTFGTPRWLLAAVIRLVLRAASHGWPPLAFTCKACSGCSAVLAVVARRTLATGAAMQVLALLRRLGVASCQRFLSVRQLGVLVARAALALNLHSAQRLLASAAISTVLFEGRRAYDRRLPELEEVKIRSCGSLEQPRWCGRLFTLMRPQADPAQTSQVARRDAASRCCHQMRTAPSEDAASRVLDWLFVGGERAANNKGRLQELGISHVLNCCANLSFASGETRNQRLHLKDVRTERLLPHLAEAFAFLDEAKCSGGRCLVHCRQGASRSVSIVLAYLVMRDGLRLQEAWQLVRRSRPAARPNRGFCQQLVDLDRVVHGEASSTVAEFYAAVVCVK
eukprot:gb/GFBE01031172.1/.p1 GENE.gb/GFBE01031172.1/~~gb/GFBE01031172.1/.p1  ORF type:complete len:386 (+),score=53.52 gb/GFBE01031172.1/:1-1158(+)